jgi:hypothetical protein
MFKEAPASLEQDICYMWGGRSKSWLEFSLMQCWRQVVCVVTMMYN